MAGGKKRRKPSSAAGSGASQPVSDLHLHPPRSALVGRDGRQRPPAGEAGHGGELRSRHHQVELGQLGGVAGDVSPARRRRRGVCVALKKKTARAVSASLRPPAASAVLMQAHVEQRRLPGASALQLVRPGRPAGVVARAPARVEGPGTSGKGLRSLSGHSKQRESRRSGQGRSERRLLMAHLISLK